MKLSFLTLQFKRYPLETSFLMARRYGFDGIELWGARPHANPYDGDDALVRDILRWKREYGVEIPMYTPELLAYPYNLASALPREREETVAYLKRAARFCAAIECPGMLVSCDHPGYGRNASEAWGDLVSGLREVCREADALGVSVSMESLGPNTSPIVSRADDLARLIADVGVPSFGAMLDMAIPPLAAEPMSEYLDKLGGRLRHVHLCGCDGIYETHLQVAPGSGTISFESFLPLLKAHGYDGWCSVEVLEPYFRDPEFYLSEAKRYLDGLLG